VINILAEILVGGVSHKAGAEVDKKKLKRAKILCFALLIAGTLAFLALCIYLGIVVNNTPSVC
jgi:hypothetical protein